MAHKKTSKDSYLRSNNSIIKRAVYLKLNFYVIFIVLLPLNLLIFYGILNTFPSIVWKNMSNINTTLLEFLEDINEDNIKKGYSIYTPGCRIQEFVHNDSAVLYHLDKLFRFNCSYKPALILVRQPFLVVNYSALPEYGGVLNYCLYVPIFRAAEGKSDDKYKFGVEKRFAFAVKIQHEFIKVECFSFHEKMYTDFFPFIFKKPAVEKRCEILNNLNSLTNHDQEKLSILMMGVDSVSRMGFARCCPKTRNYLLKNMKAIELKGYNKVGDNTFHNLVPMFLGTYVSELEWTEKESFDKYQFIWKEYAKHGYRTAFAEDDPNITLFNYYKRGFYYSPADYYLRPFFVAFAESDLYYGNFFQCLGRKLQTKVILDYAYDFVKLFSKKLFFSNFYMSSLTHSYLDAMQLADHLYEAFLRKVTEKKYLNNTVLFFFSDHGIRFGRFRGTYVGRLEERLPMAYVILPSWFKTKYPHSYQSLKQNSNRLTTPFDIYATLKHLLNFTKQLDSNTSTNPRSISLFNEISENRTCDDASILPHWCTCQEKYQISRDNETVKEAAYFIVEEINNFTLQYRQNCAKLFLKSIDDAWFSSLNKNNLRYARLRGMGYDEKVRFYKNKVSEIKDLTIVVTTEPNNGEFEATVRYNEHNGLMMLMGDISRINMYGNQSDCIQDYNLKKYCYCRHKNYRDATMMFQKVIFQ